MLPIFARAALRFIPNTIGGAWKTITNAKDAYEIYDAAKTFISEMSVPAKVASVAAVAGIASAPFMIPSAVEKVKETQVVYEHLPPDAVTVLDDSLQKVYPEAFLRNNRNLLQQILISCKTDPNNSVERCNQATIAEEKIYAEFQRKRLERAAELKW